MWDAPGHARLLGMLPRIWLHPLCSREALRAFQEHRLRRLVRGVHARVPYYRRLLHDAGVRPEDVRGLGDLPAVPITTKDDLRARPLAEIVAHGIPLEAMRRRRTSGSTGQPFAIYRTAPEDRLLYLFRLRALLQQGVRLRDRTALAIEPVLGGARPPGAWARFGRRLGVMRVEALDGLRPPEELLAALEHLGPQVLRAYPSALAQLAALLEPRSRLRPRLLLSGGESLLPPVRRRIERAFGAPVFDLYGAHEFNLLAWQCPASGWLHVCDDHVVLEILRDGLPAPPGEAGEVVATGLHQYAMPFLRYRIGDVARRAPGPCPCGQPFAALEHVQGRTLDYLRLPGDRRLHPYVLSGPLIEREGHWIDRHQLVQESLRRVVLRVQPRAAVPEGAAARLACLGREMLGPDVELDVEIVGVLGPGPGGKFQPYRSRIAEAEVACAPEAT